MDSLRILHLAVLISGAGRTLANLLTRIHDGTLPARIHVVVSSKPGVKGLEIARAAGIPAITVPRRNFPDDAGFSKAVYAALAPHPAELICMAGWIHRLDIPPQWKGRIVNIHPALLPKFGGKGFYGERVHKAVLAAGDKESGCTVHWVDNEYDHGPMILQKRVPVLPGDTPESLGARVLAAEFEAYPEALRRLASE